MYKEIYDIQKTFLFLLFFLILLFLNSPFTNFENLFFLWQERKEKISNANNKMSVLIWTQRKMIINIRRFEPSNSPMEPSILSVGEFIDNPLRGGPKHLGKWVLIGAAISRQTFYGATDH